MILKKLVSSIFGRFLSVAMAFASAVVCGRFLSKADAAFYFWIVSASAFFSLIISCGFNQTIHKIIDEEEKSGGDDNSAIIVCYKYMLICFLIVFFIAATISFGLIYSGNSATAIKIITAVVCGLFLSLSIFTSEVFRHKEMHFNAGISSGLYINTSVIIFVIINKYLNEFNFPVLLVASYISGAFLSLYGLNFKEIFKSKKSASIKTKDIYYNIFIGVCSFIVMQAHIFMVGLFFNDGVSADFSAAARISALILIIPPMIHQSSVKEYVKKFQEDKKHILSGFVRKMTILASIMVAPLFLSMFLFSEDVIKIIFGERYIGGNVILIILSAAAFLNVIRGPSGMLLILFGFSKLQAIVTGCCSFFVLSLMFWGCINHDAYILAYSVLGGVVLQGAAEAIFLKKKTGIKIY